MIQLRSSMIFPLGNADAHDGYKVCACLLQYKNTWKRDFKLFQV